VPRDDPEMRLLDLFCGRWGWSKTFAARGWECVGVDLVEPPEIPDGCTFVKENILAIKQVRRVLFGGRDPVAGESLQYSSTPYADYLLGQSFDFIVASSPCEEFSKYGLRCFFPDGPYPSNGIKLFNHTREICWKSGVPWVMENVRAAQEFVGRSKHNCGPFHLWGTGVPPLMPQGIIKGMTRKALGHYDYEGEPGWNTKNERASRRQNESNAAALAATIPPELANCVAEYAERITEGTLKEPKFKCPGFAARKERG
jgi:hypothetical protein